MTSTECHRLQHDILLQLIMNQRGQKVHPENHMTISIRSKPQATRREREKNATKTLFSPHRKGQDGNTHHAVSRCKKSQGGSSGRERARRACLGWGTRQFKHRHSPAPPVSLVPTPSRTHTLGAEKTSAGHTYYLPLALRGRLGQHALLARQVGSGEADNGASAAPCVVLV